MTMPFNSITIIAILVTIKIRARYKEIINTIPFPEPLKTQVEKL
jgi:hypothetical protein